MTLDIWSACEHQNLQLEINSQFSIIVIIIQKYAILDAMAKGEGILSHDTRIASKYLEFVADKPSIISIICLKCRLKVH